MTDEMTVQGQRPSAIPYLLGGAAVGGAAGYFQDNLTGWNGVPKGKYHSMDDIAREKHDTFTKIINDSEASQELKDSAQKLENARKEYFTYKNDHLAEAKHSDKLKTEVKALAEKQAASKTAVNEAVNDIAAKIKNNEIPIDGLDHTKASPEEINKAARKYLHEHIGDDAYKNVKESRDAVKTARKALIEKAKAEGVSSGKIIEGLKERGETIFNGVKEDAARFKTANKWWNAAIGAVVLGLGALLLRPKAKDQ